MGSMDLIRVVKIIRILVAQNSVDLNFSDDVIYSFLFCLLEPNACRYV